MIGAAAGWKFPGLEGINTRRDQITAFPAGVPGVTYGPGGIPVQADQDAWIAEYQVFKTADDAAKQTRADDVRNNVGQGNSVPDIVARLDDLILRLQDLGVIPE